MHGTKTSVPEVVVNRLRDIVRTKENVQDKARKEVRLKLEKKYMTEILGKNWSTKLYNAGIDVYISSKGREIINTQIDKILGPYVHHCLVVEKAIQDYDYKKALGQAPELATLVAEIEKLLK